MIKSNVHTHTNFCDGANTPREMVQRAIQLGFTDIGFSSHSPTPFYPACPGIVDEAEYRNEIRRLADEYCGKIHIKCGVEADTYAPVNADDYDYVIGSNHFLPAVDGGFYNAADGDKNELLNAIKTHYDGDAMAMLRGYFALQLSGVEQQQPDIVGHFDLPKKFNRLGDIFDETSKEYSGLALQYLDAVLDILDCYGGLLEVNTGAMSRGLRDDPYPATFLLEHAAKRKARVIITSDSHSVQTLNAFFPEMEALLLQVGFRQMTVLKDGVFQSVSL